MRLEEPRTKNLEPRRAIVCWFLVLGSRFWGSEEGGVACP